MSLPTPGSLNTSLTADELEEVFHALDELEPEGAGADRRKDARHLCRDLEQVVLVLNPDVKSKRAAHRVVPNDLSVGGGSVLLAQMLYPDTRCALVLQNLEGQFVAIRGIVRRCRFVTRKIHEVAIVFQTPIRVQDFLAIDEPETEQFAEQASASGDVPTDAPPGDAATQTPAAHREDGSAPPAQAA